MNRSIYCTHFFGLSYFSTLVHFFFCISVNYNDSDSTLYKYIIQKDGKLNTFVTCICIHLNSHKRDYCSTFNFIHLKTVVAHSFSHSSFVAQINITLKSTRYKLHQKSMSSSMFGTLFAMYCFVFTSHRFPENQHVVALKKGLRGYVQ